MAADAEAFILLFSFLSLLGLFRLWPFLMKLIQKHSFRVDNSKNSLSYETRGRVPAYYTLFYYDTYPRIREKSKSRGSKSLPFHSGSDAMIDCAVRALEGDLIHKIPARARKLAFSIKERN